MKIAHVYKITLVTSYCFLSFSSHDVNERQDYYILQKDRQSFAKEAKKLTLFIFTSRISQDDGIVHESEDSRSLLP